MYSRQRRAWNGRSDKADADDDTEPAGWSHHFSSCHLSSVAATKHRHKHRRCLAVTSAVHISFFIIQYVNVGVTFSAIMT